MRLKEYFFNLTQLLIYILIIIIGMSMHSNSARTVLILCFIIEIILSLILILSNSNYKKPSQYFRLLFISTLFIFLAFKILFWRGWLTILLVSVLCCLIFWVSEIIFENKRMVISGNIIKQNIFPIFMTIALVGYTLKYDAFSKFDNVDYKIFTTTGSEKEKFNDEIISEIKTFQIDLLKNRTLFLDTTHSNEVSKSKSDLVAQIIQIENNMSQFPSDPSYRKYLEWEQATIIKSLTAPISPEKFDSLNIITNKVLDIAENIKTN